MKLAMIEVDRELREHPDLRARLLLQVHDERVLEVSEADLMATAALVKRTMEGVADLSVPLVVELSSGPNWEEQADLAIE